MRRGGDPDAHSPDPHGILVYEIRMEQPMKSRISAHFVLAMILVIGAAMPAYALPCFARYRFQPCPEDAGGDLQVFVQVVLPGGGVIKGQADEQGQLILSLPDVKGGDQLTTKIRGQRSGHWYSLDSRLVLYRRAEIEEYVLIVSSKPLFSSSPICEISLHQTERRLWNLIETRDL